MAINAKEIGAYTKQSLALVPLDYSPFGKETKKNRLSLLFIFNAILDFDLATEKIYLNIV